MLVHISKCCRLVRSMFWFARTITSSMTRSQMLGATVVCDLWVWSLTSVAWRSLEFGPCLATSCPDAKCQGCQGSMFLVRLCQVGKFHTFMTCSCQFDGHDLTDLIRLDCSIFSTYMVGDFKRLSCCAHRRPKTSWQMREMVRNLLSSIPRDTVPTPSIQELLQAVAQTSGPCHRVKPCKNHVNNQVSCGLTMPLWRLCIENWTWATRLDCKPRKLCS